MARIIWSFREYVEGSSNKAIELYNPTAGVIDLSQYQLRFYFNGSTNVGTTIALTGSLAAGATYVVADNGASADILAVTNQQSTASFLTATMRLNWLIKIKWLIV